MISRLNFVNLIYTTVFWDEGISTEKIPSSNQIVDKPNVFFFPFW